MIFLQKELFKKLLQMEKSIYRSYILVCYRLVKKPNEISRELEIVNEKADEKLDNKELIK